MFLSLPNFKFGNGPLGKCTVTTSASNLISILCNLKLHKILKTTLVKTKILKTTLLKTILLWTFLPLISSP